ncbi:MAG: ribonucleotide reductase N-terminal alpha domain-containing protein, partial [Pyrobaculum sp.]
MARVIKRNGSVEPFSEEKLVQSIKRAAETAGVDIDGRFTLDVNPSRDIYSWELAEMVQLELLKRAIDHPELAEVAKAHLLGRIYKDVFRKPTDDSPAAAFDRSLTYNALRLFTNGNFALMDDTRLRETPAMAVGRIVRAVSKPDPIREVYYKYITELKLVPASPFWFNAGTRREMFASCFTLEVEDCLS